MIGQPSLLPLDRQDHPNPIGVAPNHLSHRAEEGLLLGVLVSHPLLIHGNRHLKAHRLIHCHLSSEPSIAQLVDLTDKLGAYNDGILPDNLFPKKLRSKPLKNRLPKLPHKNINLIILGITIGFVLTLHVIDELANLLLGKGAEGDDVDYLFVHLGGDGSGNIQRQILFAKVSGWFASAVLLLQVLGKSLVVNLNGTLAVIPIGISTDITIITNNHNFINLEGGGWGNNFECSLESVLYVPCCELESVPLQYLTSYNTGKLLKDVLPVSVVLEKLNLFSLLELGKLMPLEDIFTINHVVPQNQNLTILCP